jgi:hypothetical protein
VAKNYRVAAIDFAKAYELSETLSDDSQEDMRATLLNQAAWTYYKAGVSSFGDDATQSFAKSKALFELGREKYPNDAAIAYDHAIFLVDQYGLSQDVVQLVNFVASHNPERAALFASAPQTKALRARYAKVLENWNDCLTRVSGGVESNKTQAPPKACALGFNSNAGLFVQG